MPCLLEDVRLIIAVSVGLSFKVTAALGYQTFWNCRCQLALHLGGDRLQQPDLVADAVWNFRSKVRLADD